MEQTKRFLTDRSTDDKRKKIRVAAVSITNFEDLSNELLYDVFEYLDFYHVYNAFFKLNSRYQDLLINSTVPVNIHISLMSKSTFQCYTTDMILPNRDRIHSLHISNQFIYTLPLSPTGMLTGFTRLGRLVLDNMPSKGLEIILLQLIALPLLSSLSITAIDSLTYNETRYAEDNRNAIYTQLFRLPALKYCKLSLKVWSRNQSLPVATNEYSSIEHIVIIHKIYLNELSSLLSYIPQLRRFDAHSLESSSFTSTEGYPRVLNHLTDVFLKLTIPFDRFAQLIMDFFPKIEVLRITIPNKIYASYEDKTNWERLILTHLPRLRIFDIRHEDWSRQANTYPLLTNSEINPFISSFWIERQWFFTHQHSRRRYADRTIFYSTNPYRRKDYVLCGPSTDAVCLESSKTHLQSVHHVRIQSEKAMVSCGYHFPNAIELTLEDGFTTHLGSISANLNRLLPLRQLTKLVIGIHYFSFIKLIELLYPMPNIHTLVLESMPLYGITKDAMEQHETFRAISNRNTITHITFKDVCTLDQIQLLIALCPRVQHLAIHIRARDLEPFARSLFESAGRYAHSLNSLSFRRASSCWLRKLNTLIQSERLLNEHMLTHNGSTLHLWW